MKFDLCRPCPNCPFRSDIPGYLTRARAMEIAMALLSDASFSCHKTNTFDDETGEACEANASHCAGALIFLEHQDRPNQMMRWMERIDMYDRRKLDMDSPVFDCAGDFIKHHGRGRRSF